MTARALYRAASRLVVQPPEVVLTTIDDRQHNDLGNRIAVQLAHPLLQSSKTAPFGLNDQQLLFALFNLTFPTINRLHGRNSTDASRKPFVHESPSQTISLGPVSYTHLRAHETPEH